MQAESKDATAPAKSSSDADPDIPLAAIESVDPAVVARLPDESQVVSIKPHGSSFWTRTARIDTVLPSGSSKSYFLKTTRDNIGRDMVRSEYVSMSLIHRLQPHLVPEPLAWGSYENISSVHFLLCEFVPMENELPECLNLSFAKAVAEFHRASMQNADSGGNLEQEPVLAERKRRYGFDVTTYHGNVPIQHGWSDTWEEYFTRTTRHLLGVEIGARGPWSCEGLTRADRPGNEQDDTTIQTGCSRPDQEALVGSFFDKAIPRLLGPFHSTIEPVLIHGDLWHGNVGVKSDAGQIVIFDAASFWAHNEYELAVWRQPWNKIGHEHRKYYHQHLAPSEPAEEFDDRNLLYSVRVNILDSILYKDDPSYRASYIAAMRELVHKYDVQPTPLHSNMSTTRFHERDLAGAIDLL